MARQASNHPVWWYIDPSGTVQGPFPANNMITWYQEGYLHDLSLPICGTVRLFFLRPLFHVKHMKPLSDLSGHH